MGGGGEGGAYCPPIETTVLHKHHCAPLAYIPEMHQNLIINMQPTQVVALHHKSD